MKAPCGSVIRASRPRSEGPRRSWSRTTSPGTASRSLAAWRTLALVHENNAPGFEGSRLTVNKVAGAGFRDLRVMSVRVQMLAKDRVVGVICVGAGATRTADLVPA